VTDERPKSASAGVLIAPSEWRWVVIFSISIIAVISLPYVIALWTDSQNPDLQFTGFLVNPQDGATYLSKIQLGREGYWRTFFRHTPLIDQEGAYLDVFYTGLGHLTQYMGMSNLLAFHVSRLVTAFLMVLSLYHLGATIWRRTRTRRIFAVFVMLGSGLGWLVFMFGVENTPDIAIPEAFPLYSAMANAHFPLAFVFLGLIAAQFVVMLRPGFKEDPTVKNGGLVVFLSALGLAFIAPHALIPITGGLFLVVVVNAYRKRRVYMSQFRWAMMLVLPAAPLAIYYMAEMNYNEIVALWSAQNLTVTPFPLVYVAGFFVPLVVALPGIWRAIRRFEPDGDQFMLMWLLSNFVMVYLPFSTQRRFSIGIMIPITYFAVRSIEDWWFNNRSTKVRKWGLASIYGASALTYVFLLLVSAVGASTTSAPFLFLDVNYIQAANWVANETDEPVVVLTSEAAGLWVPGYSGMYVVYGHPYETLNADENLQALEIWRTTDDLELCQQIVQGYDVQYVLMGADMYDEDALPQCTTDLTEVQRFDDVIVYVP
jgi:hypothetical protein